ncbi:uncharacterized protein V1518DRAFT_420727 [Limtongia smithiae]|uniref:uncharacterized protein n=1 Tax=Limtongia smithiae TaxID=1125753 RepID=UPI0034CDE48A
MDTSASSVASADVQLLPSIIFTTAAQLVDCVDKKLVVVLRDGRKLIGILRSFDQYANLVLQATVERIIVGTQYCDVERGVYIIRGENVVLVGELDPDKDAVAHLTPVPLDNVYAAQQIENDTRRRAEMIKNARLEAVGFSIDMPNEDMY